MYSIDDEHDSFMYCQSSYDFNWVTVISYDKMSLYSQLQQQQQNHQIITHIINKTIDWSINSVH